MVYLLICTRAEQSKMQVTWAHKSQGAPGGKEVSATLPMVKPGRGLHTCADEPLQLLMQIGHHASSSKRGGFAAPDLGAVAPKAKPQETRWNKTKPIQIILHTSLHFQHCTQIRFRILHAKPCPNNASNSCSISSLFFSKVSAKGWGNLAWVGHFQMLKLLNIAFSRALGDSTVKLWFEALAKEAKQKPRQQTASRDATR